MKTMIVGIDGIRYEDTDLEQIPNSETAQAVEDSCVKYDVSPSCIRKNWRKKARDKVSAAKIESVKSLLVVGLKRQEISAVLTIPYALVCDLANAQNTISSPEAIEVDRTIRDPKLKKAASLLKDGMDSKAAAIISGFVWNKDDRPLDMMIDLAGGKSKFIQKHEA